MKIGIIIGNTFKQRTDIGIGRTLLTTTDLLASNSMQTYMGEVMSTNRVKNEL